MIGRAASGRAATGRSSAGPGAWKPQPVSIRETVDDGWDRFRERAADALRPVYSFVAHLVRVARWVLERVAILYPVRWYRWTTAGDERTCPECGALQGRTWPEGQPVPAPPLHVNCRCTVGLYRTEWRVRYVPTWRLRLFTRQEWEWKRTGWA